MYIIIFILYRSLKISIGKKYLFWLKMERRHFVSFKNNDSYILVKKVVLMGVVVVVAMVVVVVLMGVVVVVVMVVVVVLMGVRVVVVMVQL